VREQVRRGADVISFFNTGSLLATAPPAQTFTDEEMRTIVDTAHALNRKVVADGAGTKASAMGINAAIAAGSDWVDTGIYPDDATWSAITAHKILYAPHLYAVVAAVGDSRTSLETGSMGWLPRPILETLWNLKQQPPAAIAAQRRHIPMAFASDAGVFAHGQNAGEFVEYVRAGLMPGEAIETATTNAAAALGLDHESGSIRVGYRADLIGIGGAPLKDVRALRSVELVIAAGRVEKRPVGERPAPSRARRASP
jgi:imidazolonepropionase-like amidohydrolase